MTEAGSPPARLTSFVGRERELADLAELFGTARLITLTGPGGSGKTRLALEFAASVGTPVAHVVDLAPIIDAGAMVAAIAATLGVHDPGDPIEDTLTASIGDADTFLVLDNLEQIPEAGLQVAALLAAAPGLRVLATSRAPLHVRGEHEVPVTPLADDAAVELFADRARAIDPRFTMDEDAASVAVRLRAARRSAAWRSNSRPPGRACSPPQRCSTGWNNRCPSSPRDPRTRPTGSGPCTPRSPGASTC